MQLCLSAEAAGRLAKALSHVNRAVGMCCIQCSDINVFILGTGTFILSSAYMPFNKTGIVSWTLDVAVNNWVYYELFQLLLLS